IADSWIFQGGFPLLTVDVVHDGHALRIDQEPFHYAGDLGEGDEMVELIQDAQHWVVPVIFTQSGNGAPTFEKAPVEGDRLDVELVEPVEWVLLNTQGTGFYRTLYAPPLRDALLANAQTELSAIERYGLVDDHWAGVLAGRNSA